MTQKILQRRRPKGAEALQEALSLSSLERAFTMNKTRLPLAIARYLIVSKQFDSAELCLDQAIRQSHSDKPLLIELIIEKAELARVKRKHDKASRYLAKANILVKEMNDSHLRALVRRKEGDLATTQKDYPTALEKYEQAKIDYSAAEDESGKAQTAFSVALTAFRVFDFQKALQNYQEAAEYATNAPTLHLLARIGEVDALTALSRSSEAIELCEAIEKEIRNLPGAVTGKKAINLSIQGAAQEAHAINLSRLGKAATSTQRAIFCAELAESEFSRGQPEKARFYEKEAKVYRQGLENDLPGMLLPLSRLNLMRGDIHVAEQQLFDAMIELPDGLTQSERLAYDLHKSSLCIAKAELGATTVLVDQLYAVFSKIEPAPLVFTSVLAKIASKLSAPGARAQSLSSLARVRAAQFKYEEALQLVSEAREIVQNIGEMKLFEHSLLLQRADLLNKTIDDDPDKKRDRISDLLEMGYRFESLPLDLQTTITLGLLCWHESRDEERAISYFEETASTADKYGLTLIELFSKGLLGSLLQDVGESARAEDLLSQALSRMEELGLALPVREDFEQRYRDLTGFAF
jgi:tetratricopeptide (TPR) repeat protein